MPRVAKSAPQPFSAEKLTVDVEQLVKEIAATPAAEPAPAAEKKVRRVVKKKEAAPVAAPAPAPATSAAPAKRERHPNAKTFAKINDAVKSKLAGHAHSADKTYMRRLRTHLMLGKSYEEATKIADEKKAADAAKSA
jgi:hypothetical protein